MSKFITLEEILSRDSNDLKSVTMGEFETENIGTIAYSSIDHAEYKQIKKDCLKMVPDNTGRLIPDLDDDKMTIRVVIAAVAKDNRSNFTFAHKEMREKLGVISADDVVAALLKPGEITRFATEVQNSSGFGPQEKKEANESIKNS